MAQQPKEKHMKTPLVFFANPSLKSTELICAESPPWSLLPMISMSRSPAASVELKTSARPSVVCAPGSRGGPSPFRFFLGGRVLGVVFNGFWCLVFFPTKWCSKVFKGSGVLVFFLVFSTVSSGKKTRRIFSFAVCGIVFLCVFDKRQR